MLYLNGDRKHKGENPDKTGSLNNNFLILFFQALFHNLKCRERFGIKAFYQKCVCAVVFSPLVSFIKGIFKLTCVLYKPILNGLAISRIKKARSNALKLVFVLSIPCLLLF
jgi:hypothetical protein